MTEEYKVKYLKHPVDMKEVKKWRAKGFDVIDARFDPNPKAAPVVDTPAPIITGSPAIADDKQTP
jgi:hypothetical protein